MRFAISVVGKGHPGRAGHVGIVDEVHELVRDSHRRIVAIDYTGWEANFDGASSRRRRWSPGQFASVSVVRLRERAADEPGVVIVGQGPLCASRRDSGSGSVTRSSSCVVPGEALWQLLTLPAVRGLGSEEDSTFDVRAILDSLRQEETR